MTEFILWGCLTEKEQRKLRERFPFFKPPPDPWEKKLINLDIEMEDTEEIGRLIRQKPVGVKRNGRW